MSLVFLVFFFFLPSLSSAADKIRIGLSSMSAMHGAVWVTEEKVNNANPIAFGYDDDDLLTSVTLGADTYYLVHNDDGNSYFDYPGLDLPAQDPSGKTVIAQFKVE